MIDFRNDPQVRIETEGDSQRLFTLSQATNQIISIGTTLFDKRPEDISLSFNVKLIIENSVNSIQKRFNAEIELLNPLLDSFKSDNSADLFTMLITLSIIILIATVIRFVLFD